MFIKNKKGFSLLEVLVTMGIVTVLAGIAIPAYNQYKEGVKDTAVKSDISNARKAYLAYDAVNNTFCVSLAGAGLAGLGESDTYKKADAFFMGLKLGTGTGACASNDPDGDDIKKEKGSDVGGNSCTLKSSTFKMGAGFKKGGHTVGYSIANNSSGPEAAVGVCSKAGLDSKADCDADKGANGIEGDSDDPTWTASVTDLCS